jgi:hypothetical protein
LLSVQITVHAILAIGWSIFKNSVAMVGPPGPEGQRNRVEKVAWFALCANHRSRHPRHRLEHFQK